jgi:hypothetical protein
VACAIKAIIVGSVGPSISGHRSKNHSGHTCSRESAATPQKTHTSVFTAPTVRRDHAESYRILRRPTDTRYAGHHSRYAINTPAALSYVIGVAAGSGIFWLGIGADAATLTTAIWRLDRVWA